MKNILYLLCWVVTFFSCSNSNQDTSASQNQINTLYKVYKVDSINSYYLIYVSKRDTNYKIVSKREFTENCNKITKGDYYDFNLSSMSIGEIMSPGFANCIWVDSTTKVCLEDSIFDLKSASNIKGLCYETKK
jgi:hypothetical protein